MEASSSTTTKKRALQELHGELEPVSSKKRINFGQHGSSSSSSMVHASTTTTTTTTTTTVHGGSGQHQHQHQHQQQKRHNKRTWSDLLLLRHHDSDDDDDVAADEDDDDDDDDDYVLPPLRDDEPREATYVAGADGAYASWEMPKRMNLGYDVGQASAWARALDAADERDAAVVSRLCAAVRNACARAAKGQQGRACCSAAAPDP